MIDFLFSSKQGGQNKLLAALRGFRSVPKLTFNEWSALWGSLVTIGPSYPGFNPVETDQHIIIVLGGPLPRYDSSIATGEHADDGTLWILERWKNHNKIAWDDELLGHFLIACLDKTTGKLAVVTDINAFVPVYIAEAVDGESHVIVGSHADAVAIAASCEQNIDPVSIADFLTYKTVTYPYTMYKGIRQLPAASEIKVSTNGNQDVRTYWLPEEQEPPFT